MNRTSTSTSTLWLIVNAASGSNDDQAREVLIAGLADQGHVPARVLDMAAEPELSPDVLTKAKVDLVALFAGDGTVGAVINQLSGWHGQILVLPGGTTNLLARAIHGDDVTTDAVLADLGAGKLAPVRRNGLRWSGGMAVCEILGGPGATWSDVREELREGNLVGMMQTALDAARQSGNGPLVRLRDPDIGKSEGYGGVRLVPEDQGITVDGYGPESVADYLRQGLALLLRNFREGPHDELGLHPVVHCETVDGSPMDLMIDGERRTGEPEEMFSLAPLPVNLLAPRA